jgi:hypothetical protein
MEYVNRVNPDPGQSRTGDDGGMTEQEKDDIEKNGRYLMLYHLPLGTTGEAVSNTRVRDETREVARADTAAGIPFFRDASYHNLYIPLLGMTGDPFTRTGVFYVEFTVVIDAQTKIVVRAEHRVRVEFIDGRGVLDIEKLIAEQPGVAEPSDWYDPETEQKIEDIIAGGGYIRFFNLPRNMSASKMANITVSAASTVIARCPDYESIAIRKNPVTSEAFVPLAGNRSAPFTETGSYYVTFTITVDALTRYVVDAGSLLLYPFSGGVCEIDVLHIPEPPERPPVIPHCLTVTGLPETAGPSNFMDIYLSNSRDLVAKCPDTARISVVPHAGKKAAVIPLVFDNNSSFNGQDFSDSGFFFVTFSFHPDALQSYTVTLDNRCLVEFTNGTGLLDLADIPFVPHAYLTITNLPPHIQNLNVSDVFVWNQSGKIGKCEDYNLLIIEQGTVSSTLKIPLVYNSVDQIFEETGAYYVSFDLNVDALVRVNITPEDNVVAQFFNGGATLDASLLPQALPVPYLTILGLPLTTAKNNFSEVFLYNAVGKVAKCSNYQDIVITRGDQSATALIPLAYASSSLFFRDSGQFIVSFTANVDAQTQIIVSSTDGVLVQFTDGSGIFDMFSHLGYFSGGLVNPSDTSPPVLKKGTVIEINGGYSKLDANTSVDPLAPRQTSLLYIYAVREPGRIRFEYSATPPVFHAQKNGYYLGDKRALYKLVYIKDTVDQYVAKTWISDPFRHFDRYLIQNPGIGQPATQAHYSLPGAGNPQPKTTTLQPGAYIVRLTGGGGGGGGGIDGIGSRDRSGGAGGSGGSVAELVTLASSVTLTLYAGQGGNGSAHIPYGQYQGCGGGGGGAGSFVFTTAGYFLCAGGGGGGGGGAANDGGGGGGGAGGSTGGGGGGGGGGSTPAYPGSAGGAGGGYGAGAGGGSTANGSTSTGYGPANAYGGGGAGSKNDGGGGKDGGQAGHATFSNYPAPDTWKNTNGARGQGGAGQTRGNGLAGETGGNNRNTIRGGGSAGGAGGKPSDSTQSAGGKGGDGSISIYKIF